jgi:hypothetical protein
MLLPCWSAQRLRIDGGVSGISAWFIWEVWQAELHVCNCLGMNISLHPYFGCVGCDAVYSGRLVGKCFREKLYTYSGVK